jgi:hypothetical protein
MSLISFRAKPLIRCQFCFPRARLPVKAANHEVTFFEHACISFLRVCLTVWAHSVFLTWLTLYGILLGSFSIVYADFTTTRCYVVEVLAFLALQWHEFDHSVIGGLVKDIRRVYFLFFKVRHISCLYRFAFLQEVTLKFSSKPFLICLFEHQIILCKLVILQSGSRDPVT